MTYLPEWHLVDEYNFTDYRMTTICILSIHLDVKLKLVA
jgi:hypothetical protein